MAIKRKYRIIALNNFRVFGYDFGGRLSLLRHRISSRFSRSIPGTILWKYYVKNMQFLTALIIEGSLVWVTYHHVRPKMSDWYYAGITTMILFSLISISFKKWIWKLIDLTARVSVHIFRFILDRLDRLMRRAGIRYKKVLMSVERE